MGACVCCKCWFREKNTRAPLPLALGSFPPYSRACFNVYVFVFVGERVKSAVCSAEFKRATKWPIALLPAIESAQKVQPPLGCWRSIKSNGDLFFVVY